MSSLKGVGHCVYSASSCNSVEVGCHFFFLQKFSLLVKTCAVNIKVFLLSENESLKGGLKEPSCLINYSYDVV